MLNINRVSFKKHTNCVLPILCMYLRIIERDDELEVLYDQNVVCVYQEWIIDRSLLEHRLPNKYTCSDIIQTLRQMNLTQIGKEGFIPSYTRTALTDALHDVAGFSTDFEFIPRTSTNKLCFKARQLRK